MYHCCLFICALANLHFYTDRKIDLILGTSPGFLVLCRLIVALQCCFTARNSSSVKLAGRIALVCLKLEILNGQFHRLNSFNKVFQTAEQMLHPLRNEALKILKNILSDFLHLPADKLNMCVNATITSSDCIDRETAIKVKRACFGFMIELVKQIEARFHISDPVFKVFEILLSIFSSLQL